ncbi:MAG TPA: hypothetical protein VL096_06885 [Pirellulaceae bacterium]|nr:hypothetical protein [Pirellulaceae bacterium]
MNVWLLAAALFCGPPPVEDGSLLFLENSNQFVELYTGSEITHVAMLINVDGEPWVYEATPSVVRGLTWTDYYAELGELNKRRAEAQKIRVWLVRPRSPYKPEQVTALRESMQAQVGRRYSVKSYVRGKSDGIHCAELATRALCAASVLTVDQPQSECPSTLLEKIKPVSKPLAAIHITEPETRASWSERSWSNCAGFGSWCGWSCWEAWSFCW